MNVRRRLRRLLVLIAILVAVTVSVGGGGTYVALQVTTKPEFCKTCHIMVPYYDSWASSSHADVTCVDCHYEPGLLETFEGKFKALSQLAKYVTGTAGTKPWAEVSDYSCMRSGCHSERMLEGEIRYGRIRFDHRTHLAGLRRGKKLRCTSCHSQIVQGEHLTVTKSSCILCHFKESDEPTSTPIDTCETCHGPPPEEIELGGFVFRHSEYLDRGVTCDSCHGDITRGTGEVPRARCGSCHNQQAHLDRYGDTDFLHRHHVTDHSVNCLECHIEIEHGLPSREEHFRSDCGKCHVGAHAVSADLYRGTGGQGVPDNPSVMFLARVTCNGCHRPPFPGAPTPPEGATWEADPLACLDCHGPGFEGMTARWQAETRETVEKVKEALGELDQAIGEPWEEGDPEQARAAHERAARNLGAVLLDRSEGAHNLPFARDLLRQAASDVREGWAALDPAWNPDPIPIGPAVPSEQGCTTLCHVGIESQPVEQAYGLPFDHARHVTRARFDCSKCHLEEPHGTTIVERASCVACHHESDEPKQCRACHSDVAGLRDARTETLETIAMEELDCVACHETLADGHSREGVAEACAMCHDGDEEGSLSRDLDRYVEVAREPLTRLEEALAKAPDHPAAAEVRAEIARIRAAGAFHNPEYVAARAAELERRLR